MQSYVVSSDDKLNITTPDTSLVTIQDLPDLINKTKEQTSKDIWLIGGGQLITQFLNLGLLDRMEIIIVPTIIGSDIPLFPLNPKESTWKLIDSTSYSTGVVALTYEQ